MSFDSIAMAAVAAELRGLVGAQVQQVHQPDRETVVITLRSGGRNQRLLLCVQTRYARVHLITGNVAHPDTPPAFCMLLRKYIKGSYLDEARQVDFDRVLHLTFRYGETAVCLVLEVMGKHSNLMLVDAAGTVLDAIKRVGPHESRVRPIYPGVAYTPPPTGEKHSPAAATPELVQAALAAEPGLTVGDALRASFFLGPTALAAVLGRCESAATTTADTVPAATVRCLAEALHWVTDAEAYQPAWVCDAREVPVDISFLPAVPLPEGTRRVPAESASEVLEGYYVYHIDHEAVEDRRRAWLRALADESRFCLRRIREAETGIEAAGTAPELEHEATLLLANLKRIPRGAASVAVVDFYDPEQPTLTLALDPTLSPQEQAEKRFKRARKLNDAVPHLERQWETEQERLEKLRALRPRVEAARTLEELDALTEALREAGALRERVPQAPPARRAEQGPGVQHRQIGQYEVLLGRNATENDYLTTRLADANDWWLHARGITSAHVVIRTAKHPERVPPEVLREAAKLCALHSQAKHSRLVPVDYTLRKHVVKRRGSAPGEVQYTHEKTLHIEPEG